MYAERPRLIPANSLNLSPETDDMGHVVHTQYLASSAEGKRDGALDLLLHNLITVVYADRSYFDFGVSTENGGGYLNEGLIFQKEGFGARSVVYDTYEMLF